MLKKHILYILCYLWRVIRKRVIMGNSSIKTSCTVAREDCTCFDKLTEKQRGILEENQITINYKKGESIAKHGAFTSNIIFICTGLVKVYYENRNESLILKIVGPRTLVGLTSLSNDNSTFPYSVSAYIDTTVKLIDINLFRKFIEENGAFSSAIIDILCENNNQINSRFFCLTHRQSYGKLADLLLCLAGSIFKQATFDLNLTRKELAELAGMSTESVIRILKKFQDDKLISVKGKTIELTNPEGLQQVCDLG